MKFLMLLISIMFFSGCASLPDEEAGSAEDRPLIPGPSTSTRPIPEIYTGTDPTPQIDYLGLARGLGLENPKDELGYNEKSFDTCAVGYGYSASNNCRREFFSAVNFQILCRDSEGTVSVAIGREDMKPLSGRELKWTFRGRRGSMRLDGEGYGQINMTFAKSPRSERLKLAVDNDFVYIRASEVKRLVVPKNWCN